MSLDLRVKRNTLEVHQILEDIQTHIDDLKNALVDPELTEVETARLRGQIMAFLEIVSQLKSPVTTGDID